jgi:hypothetical protein
MLGKRARNFSHPTQFAMIVGLLTSLCGGANRHVQRPPRANYEICKVV